MRQVLLQRNGGSASLDLLEAARTLAAPIARNPPAALRPTKMLLREAQTGRLDTVLELSAAAPALVHQTEDHEEAGTAFFGKRKPAFSGR